MNPCGRIEVVVEVERDHLSPVEQSDGEMEQDGNGQDKIGGGVPEIDSWELRSKNKDLGLESDSQTQCIMADEPLSEGTNYFEIKLMHPPEDGDGIGILLKTDQMPYRPGWEFGSIGYHAKDGGLYNQCPTTELCTATCKEGDTMGCGIDYTTAKDGYIFVWFTKNGQLVSYPQKLEFPPLSEPIFHPLICCNAHAVKYKKSSWKTSGTITPWWEIAGFKSADDMPSVPTTSSGQEYLPKLHMEVEDAKQLQALVMRSKVYHFEDLLEDLTFNCDTFTDWLDKAGPRIMRKQWELEADVVQKDAIAKCLATKVLEKIGGEKDSAIPLFLAAPFRKKQFLEVSVVGGLLNLGCPPKVFLDKHYHCISPSCLKLLLDSGANPNVVDADGNTALHIFQNDISKVEILLDKGANAKVQNKAGDTPLHLAAKAGQITLAEMLLLNGASASITNNERMSPLDVAAATGLSECFKSMFLLATRPKPECCKHSDLMKWKEAAQKWKEILEGLKSNVRAVCHAKMQEMTREEVYYASVHTSYSKDRPDKQSVQKMLSLAEEHKIDLEPEVLETILNSCLYGGNLVVTDMLEADLKGDLPVDKRLSTCKPDGDKTVHAVEEDQTDIGRSVKPTSLLPYLGKRPKLDMYGNLFIDEYPRAYLKLKFLNASVKLIFTVLEQVPALQLQPHYTAIVVRCMLSLMPVESSTNHWTYSFNFFKLSSHPTLKTFIQFQWNRKATRWFRFWLSCYILKMVILTFALIIAARPELTDDQLNKYPQPLDYFRGICEVLLLIIILLNILDEVLEFAQSGWSAYLQDQLNHFQWLSIILTLLIIPLRATDHHWQWIVASLAYFSHGSRAFQHASLLKLTGPYVHALLIIAARDILRFMVVFMIMLAMFSGAFYLSLRYDDSIIKSASSNTTSPGGGINSDQRELDGEGQLLHEVYFTGLRVLIEAGSALSYYGANGSLRLLSVVLYLMFLFMIVIVLLNTLIAQVSHTYTKVLSTAEGVHLFYQCAYIAKLEKRKSQFLILCLKMPHGRCWRCLQWLGRKIGCSFFASDTLNDREVPNRIWIRKKQKHGRSKCRKLLRAITNLFVVHGFGEDDDSTLAKVVQKETDQVEEKIEEEVKKLAKQLKVCAVSERKIGEEVTKLAEQLVSKEEEVRKLQQQLLHKEEEVKKQLEEMMSLLRKEPEDALEPSDRVSSREGEEPSYPEST